MLCQSREGRCSVDGVGQKCMLSSLRKSRRQRWRRGCGSCKHCPPLHPPTALHPCSPHPQAHPPRRSPPPTPHPLSPRKPPNPPPAPSPTPGHILSFYVIARDAFRRSFVRLKGWCDVGEMASVCMHMCRVTAETYVFARDSSEERAGYTPQRSSTRSQIR